MEADSPPPLTSMVRIGFLQGGAVFFCDVDSLSVHQSSGTAPWVGKRSNDKQAYTSPTVYIEALRAGSTAARVIPLLARRPP